MATISLSIPVAGSVTLALHQNNYAAIQAAVNALDTVNYADASVTRPKLATVTRKADMVVFTATAASPATNGAWPDAATNTVYWQFGIPDDYVSGDLTVKIMRVAGASSGTAVMSYSASRRRDNAAQAAIHTAVAANLVAADTNDHVLSVTITAANFQAGDAITFNMARDGANGADTLASFVHTPAAWFEYTGRS